MAEIIIIPEGSLVEDIDIFIDKQTHIPYVNTKQYDTGTRYIRATIWNNGDIYPMLETDIINLTATKPDRLPLFNRAGIDEDGKIVYEITDQTTSAYGVFNAEFRIYNTKEVNGETVTTKKTTYDFKINVAKSNVQDTEIISTPEFNALTDAIGILGDLIADAEDVIDIANTAINDAIAATEASILATTNTNEKAVLANNAANLANTKAGLADAAATLANTKAGLADSAATSANSAATLANTKAGLADSAATNANSAATNANNVANQLATETLKIFKPAVTNYSNLATTYPSPQNGWTVTVTSETVSYRYNGTAWINLGVIASVNIATDTVAGIVKGGGNVIIDGDGKAHVDLSGFAETSKMFYPNSIYGGILTDNVNTVNVTGFYTSYGTGTGVPNTASSWYIIHINSNAGVLSAYQRATSFTTSNTYERIKVSGTWGGWVLTGLNADSKDNTATFTEAVTEANIASGETHSTMFGKILKSIKTFRTAIGTLSSLTTTVKTSLVAAINELKGNVGNLASLTTTSNTDLVVAINDNTSDINSKRYNAKYPPLSFYILHGRAKGDDTTDDAGIIQELTSYIAGIGGGTLFLPKGTYKFLSSYIANSNVTVEGAGEFKTVIKAYNCDGIIINNTWGATIRDLSIYSIDAVGNWYPKVHTGIKCNGTDAANSINNCKFENIDIKGFLISLDLRYTWDTEMNHIKTLNCKFALQLFGQSVNNILSDSFLKVDNQTGSAAVNLIRDGSVMGEGLMISNSFLGSGEYGVISQDFLALKITNCTMDLIQKNAFNLTSMKALSVTGSWIWSVDDCFKINDVSVLEDQYCMVIGNTITSLTGTSGILLGNNVEGWNFVGNSITASNVCLYTEISSKHINFSSNKLKSINNYVYPIFLAGTKHNISNNTGTCAIQHYNPNADNTWFNNEGTENLEHSFAEFSINADASIPNDTSTLVVLDKVNSGKSYATLSSGKVQILKAGTYLINIGMSFANDTTGRRTLILSCAGSINSTLLIDRRGASGDTAPSFAQACKTVDLASGDLLSFNVSQVSGGTLNLLANVMTFIQVKKIG